MRRRSSCWLPVLVAVTVRMVEAQQHASFAATRFDLDPSLPAEDLAQTPQLQLQVDAEPQSISTAVDNRQQEQPPPSPPPSSSPSSSSSSVPPGPAPDATPSTVHPPLVLPLRQQAPPNSHQSVHPLLHRQARRNGRRRRDGRRNRQPHQFGGAPPPQQQQQPPQAVFHAAPPAPPPQLIPARELHITKERGVPFQQQQQQQQQPFAPAAFSLPTLAPFTFPSHAPFTLLAPHQPFTLIPPAAQPFTLAPFTLPPPLALPGMPPHLAARQPDNSNSVLPAGTPSLFGPATPDASGRVAPFAAVFGLPSFPVAQPPPLPPPQQQLPGGGGFSFPQAAVLGPAQQSVSSPSSGLQFGGGANQSSSSSSATGQQLAAAVVSAVETSPTQPLQALLPQQPSQTTIVDVGQKLPRINAAPTNSVAASSLWFDENFDTTGSLPPRQQRVDPANTTRETAHIFDISQLSDATRHRLAEEARLTCAKDLSALVDRFRKKFPPSVTNTGKDVELTTVVETQLFECDRKATSNHWDKVDALLGKVQLSTTEEEECRAGLVEERIACENLILYACQFSEATYPFRLVPARKTVREARQAFSGAQKCRRVVRLVKKRMEEEEPLPKKKMMN